MIEGIYTSYSKDKSCRKRKYYSNLELINRSYIAGSKSLKFFSQGFEEFRNFYVVRRRITYEN